MLTARKLAAAAVVFVRRLASNRRFGDGINGTENYTYNNANMLQTRGSNNYTNDANGNTLTGGGRTNWHPHR